VKAVVLEIDGRQLTIVTAYVAVTSLAWRSESV
jgi:hypothetical protein